jgi:hypothetical protein
MKLKPEELEENGYILLDRMDHSELIPFVKMCLSKRTWFTMTYYLSTIVFFAFLLFFCLKLYHSGSYTIIKIFLQVLLGLLLTLTLIPVHEFIHALAYKFQGAKNTSYDVNLKKFYFLAIADRFVASKREFQIVALAPFLVISLVLLMAAFLTGELWKVTILTMLMTHSAFVPVTLHY